MQVSSRDTHGFFVNKLKANAMIKIVNKQLVNKAEVNEVKALSLPLTRYNKLLQVRNYCTTCKKTTYYTRKILRVLTIKST